MGECMDDGTVRCKYHGLQFDGHGHCTKNPHGDGKIPAAATVRSFPVIEKNGIVWFWPGEPAIATTTDTPEFSAVDDSVCHVARRYLHVKSNYVLESDNILDLSHIQFLHPGTLGSDAVQKAKTEVVQSGNTVWSKRVVSGEDLKPFLRQTFQVPEGLLADRWLDVRWDPPSSLLLSITIAPSGSLREQGVTIRIPHLFTPETETSTHYWFASCFERKEGNGSEQAERHVEGLLKPFATEDAPMLEAQQRVMGDADFWSLKPVLLPGDAAAVRARRVLDMLIKAEKAKAGAGA
jgi:vanillate O-demethylase monooxygenase subunit